MNARVASLVSHLGAVLLWAALPGWLRKKTRPVAAADYWKFVPWRRYLAERVFRSVFVERRAETARKVIDPKFGSEAAG